MSTVEATPEPGKKVDVKRMSWDPITRIVGSLGIHTEIDFANQAAQWFSLAGTEQRSLQ